jgi:hypothetical protein
MANLDTLRARVAQLEEAIARGEQESTEATGLLATEQDENVIVKLWGRITARKNSGKALAEQLTVAREEVIAAEKAEAMVKYEEARKAYAVVYADLEKAAAATLAKAEKAATALEEVTKAQRATGEKYTGPAERIKWGVDPFALYCEAAGMGVTSSWSNLTAYRPWPPTTK